MARGRRREEWSHWASWMALYAECHRDAKQRRAPYTPNDFMPPEFAEKRKPAEPMARMSLRQLAAAQGHQIAEADQPVIIRSPTNGSGSR